MIKSDAVNLIDLSRPCCSLSFVPLLTIVSPLSPSSVNHHQGDNIYISLDDADKKLKKGQRVSDSSTYRLWQQYH